MENRRSVREFSDRPISRKVIENIIKLPRQRHQVLITTMDFCVVANPEIKKTNSVAAEEEERVSYESRMSNEWLDDLNP
jgi:hypothetical protein